MNESRPPDGGRRGIARARRAGCVPHTSATPTSTHDGSVEVGAEQATLKRMRRLRKRHTYRTIAPKLNAEGITAKGRDPWRHTSSARHCATPPGGCSSPGTTCPSRSIGFSARPPDHQEFHYRPTCCNRVPTERPSESGEAVRDDQANQSSRAAFAHLQAAVNDQGRSRLSRMRPRPTRFRGLEWGRWRRSSRQSKNTT